MTTRKGFTLIELLVVIAIIGILATLSVVSLNSARAKSRDAKRLSDVKQIQTALELYYSDQTAYPVQATAINLGESTYTTFSSGAGFAATASGTTYMGVVPSDPQAPTLHYAYKAAAATSYQIDFSLEGSLGGLGSGPNCATPAGITGGACP